MFTDQVNDCDFLLIFSANEIISRRATLVSSLVRVVLFHIDRVCKISFQWTRFFLSKRQYLVSYNNSLTICQDRAGACGIRRVQDRFRHFMTKITNTLHSFGHMSNFYMGVKGKQVVNTWIKLCMLPFSVVMASTKGNMAKGWINYLKALFLAATKQLYEWYFLSVCPSVRLSVRLSHLFDYVPIIVSSWNFQELSHWTRVRSMQKVKVRGQRSRSQRSRPNFSFPDCNSSLNSHMMMKWYI